MINQYVQMLKSSDPGQRREAIIALGRSKDLAALSPLADIYRTDPDPALRELARKAGQYLRQQTAEAAPAAVSQPPKAAVEQRLRPETSEYAQEAKATKADESLRRRPATPDEAKRARAFVDDSLTANGRGDNVRAIKSLQRAIELDPDILKDAYFLSVASAVTNRSGDEAIEFLRNQRETANYAKQATRQQRDERKSKHLQAADASSWGAVGLESALYFIINAVGIILVVLITSQVIASVISNPEATQLAELDRETRRQLSSFTGIGFPVALIIAVIYAFSATINTLIYGVIVHVAAKYLFQGKGYMRHYLDKLFGFWNRWLLPMWALTILVIGAGILAPILAACFSIVLIIFSIFLLFKHTSMTAQAYDFGISMGCLSQIVAAMVPIIISVLVQMAVGASLVAALNNVLN